MDTYEDIIHLPHHRSTRRSHMSVRDRAAQFSPFAALTGFEAAIEETGRLTDCRPELMEYENTQLDQTLLKLMELLHRQPLVSVICFVPDERKSGGHCETVTGHLQKIDLYGNVLRFTDGRKIELRDILQMESPEIRDMEE